MKLCLISWILIGCALPVHGQFPQLDALKLSQMGQLLEDAQQMVFEGRAIPLTSLKILDDLTHRFPSSLEQDYARFVDKSLIVRNGEVVDDAEFQYEPFYDDPHPPRGRWTFPNLLRTALHGNDPAKIDGEVQQKIAYRSPRLDTVWKSIDKDEHLNTIPLRLLAVVNRLDLARLVVGKDSAPGAVSCPNGQLCGAEIHFVYAGMISPKAPGADDARPYLTLILEFVLPPLSKAEFQTMAWNWINLYCKPVRYDSPADMDGILTGLMQRWSEHGAARIRMNRREDNWALFQFALTTHGLIDTPLNQEPNIPNLTNTCVTDSPVGKYAAKYGAAILRSDYDFYQPPAMGESPKPTDCPTGPAALMVPQRCVAIFDTDKKNVLSLRSGFVRPPADTDAERFSLSLNSCTGCHSWETHGVEIQKPPLDEYDPFDQIRYREKGQISTMSRFLTGGEDGNPHLYNTWPVKKPPVAPGCGPAAAAKNYNDLVRRAVFHLVVVGLPTLTTPFSHLDKAIDATWSTALNGHGITAWQPH